MTVRELLGRVDSRELSEWRAFYSLEPFGSEADLFGHAMNAAHIINSQRRKNKVKVTDLMPQKKKEQSVDDMIAAAARMTVAMGGKDKRGNK